MDMDAPTQDDANFLKGIANSFFADSQRLDKAMQQRPGNLDVGAHTLSRNILDLERELRFSKQQQQQNLPVQQQNIAAPPIPPQQVSTPLPTLNIVEPPQQTPPIYNEPSPQLEFNLDPDKQDIANNLLKEISIKMTKQTDALTKLISMLEQCDE